MAVSMFRGYEPGWVYLAPSSKRVLLEVKIRIFVIALRQPSHSLYDFVSAFLKISSSIIPITPKPLSLLRFPPNPNALQNYRITHKIYEYK